ncbi:hypothetical protein JCM10207_008364 [Rhodosporidiobolus poonsookiae]
MATAAPRQTHLGDTPYDDDEIEHPTPLPSQARHPDPRNDQVPSTERTALLGSGASRDYATEAQRDRRALAAEGELDPEHRRKPWSLKITFALSIVLLLINGYFWTMTIAAVKGPFIENTALPPHRGSMFVPIWVSFLSCTTNTAALLAFLFPHESPLLAFYTSAGGGFFALLTLILSVSVTQLRVVEGPLTFILLALAIVSSIHAALSAALTDKYAPLLDPPEELDPDEAGASGFWASVKRGGRATLGFLGISLPIAAAHVAVLLAFVLIAINIILRAVDASVEQSGQRWKVDPWLWQRKHFPEIGRGIFQSFRGRDYRVHLSCRGVGLDDPPFVSAGQQTTASVETLQRPLVRRTLLVESEQGVPGSVDAEWLVKMLKDGDLNSGDVETRVCFWDRPGYGFSDGSPSSSLPHLATALTQALTVSGEFARIDPGPSATAPSPLARSGFVLVSRGRSTALTALFAALHPREVHSFLYLSPDSPARIFQSDPVTPFAALPHFFSRTLPAAWSELGLARLWWALKGVPRRRRVLAREGERVSGLIERAGVQERHERDRGRESDGAKAWEKRRGRYPVRPTVVLGKGRDGDGGKNFVEDVVGEGLREWDQKWDGGVIGCGVGGQTEQKCRDVVKALLALD